MVEVVKFNCFYCSYEVKYYRNLLFHLSLSHEGEENFQIICGVGGCLQPYNKINSLKKHISRKHIEFYEFHLGSNSIDRRTDELNYDAIDNEIEQEGNNDSHHPVKMLFHVTYGSSKKLVNFVWLNDRTALSSLKDVIKSKFNISEKFFLQYYVKDVDWVDLDKDIIEMMTEDETAIKKLNVCRATEKNGSKRSATPDSEISESSLEHESDDEDENSFAEPTHRGSWPERFEVPVQSLKRSLKNKLSKGKKAINKLETQQLMDAMYAASVQYNVYYPSPWMYTEMVTALLRKYPILAKGLTTSDAKVMWRKKLQQKFQNTRRRKHADVVEVNRRKRNHPDFNDYIQMVLKTTQSESSGEVSNSSQENKPDEENIDSTKENESTTGGNWPEQFEVPTHSLEKCLIDKLNRQEVVSKEDVHQLLDAMYTSSTECNVYDPTPLMYSEMATALLNEYPVLSQDLSSLDAKMLWEERLKQKFQNPKCLDFDLIDIEDLKQKATDNNDSMPMEGKPNQSEALDDPLLLPTASATPDVEVPNSLLEHTQEEENANSTKENESTTNGNWPEKFEVPTQFIKKRLQDRLIKQRAVNRDDVHQLLDALYNGSVQHNVYEPTSTMFTEMATALLNEYPVLSKGVSIVDAKKFWIERLQQKFQNEKIRAKDIMESKAKKAKAAENSGSAQPQKKKRMQFRTPIYPALPLVRHSTLDPEVSNSSPEQSSSKGNWPEQFEVPLHSLRKCLQDKLHRYETVNKYDIHQILDAMYTECTQYNVYYPAPWMYTEMVIALLRKFPVLCDGLDSYDAQMLWKKRLQQKFQNTRKRSDFKVAMVRRRKRNQPDAQARPSDDPSMSPMRPSSPNLDLLNSLEQRLEIKNCSYTPSSASSSKGYGNWPDQFEVPTHFLKKSLKDKLLRQEAVNKEDIHQLLDAMYDASTQYNVYYPKQWMYKEMVAALLRKYPVLGNGLSCCDAKVLWKHRLQQKFQNKRKRNDFGIEEVKKRKEKAREARNAQQPVRDQLQAPRKWNDFSVDEVKKRKRKQCNPRNTPQPVPNQLQTSLTHYTLPQTSEAHQTPLHFQPIPQPRNTHQSVQDSLQTPGYSFPQTSDFHQNATYLQPIPQAHQNPLIHQTSAPLLPISQPHQSALLFQSPLNHQNSLSQ